MNRILPRMIHQEELRRARSGPIIRAFLANRSFRVVDYCDFCGCKNISIISNLDRYGAPIRAAQCKSCGLIFLVDRLSPDDYAQFYESVYRPLISAYLGRPVNAQTIQAEQIRYAENLVPILRGAGGLVIPRTGGELLDVGGSTGIVASIFAREFNCAATVLDPSSEELEIAARQGLKTAHGLLESWNPSQKEQFDLVFCCQTIDHFFDLRKSLIKLRELTKPQGRVFIDIIDFDVVWQGQGFIEGAIKIDHCYYLCGENAEHLLRSAGLQVVFSELASHLDHVSYVCQPSEPVDIPREVSKRAVTRLQAIQRSRIYLGQALKIPRNPWDYARRKLYPLKKALLGLR